MKSKVSLLPFLKPKDLPLSHRVEIRKVNAEFIAHAKLARADIDACLSPDPDLKINEGIKNQILSYLRNVISELKFSRYRVKVTVGREVLGEDMTWSEIEELFNGLLLTVCEKIIYEETKGGKIGASPLELLMMGCDSGLPSDEVIEKPYQELGRLAKADPHTLVRMIKTGVQLELSANAKASK